MCAWDARRWSKDPPGSGERQRELLGHPRARVSGVASRLEGGRPAALARHAPGVPGRGSRSPPERAGPVVRRGLQRRCKAPCACRTDQEACCSRSPRMPEDAFRSELRWSPPGARAARTAQPDWRRPGIGVAPPRIGTRWSASGPGARVPNRPAAAGFGPCNNLPGQSQSPQLARRRSATQAWAPTHGPLEPPPTAPSPPTLGPCRRAFVPHRPGNASPTAAPRPVLGPGPGPPRAPSQPAGWRRRSPRRNPPR